jgi:hypothetical protein
MVFKDSPSMLLSVTNEKEDREIILVKLELFSGAQKIEERVASFNIFLDQVQYYKISV